MSKFNPEEFNVPQILRVSINGVMTEGDAISNGRLLLPHPSSSEHMVVLDAGEAYSILKDSKDGTFTDYSFVDGESITYQTSGEDLIVPEIVPTPPVEEPEIVMEYDGPYLVIEEECGGCGAPFGVRHACPTEFNELSKTHRVYTELQNHTMEESDIDPEDIEFVIVRYRRCMSCREI